MHRYRSIWAGVALSPTLEANEGKAHPTHLQLYPCWGRDFGIVDVSVGVLPDIHSGGRAQRHNRLAQLRVGQPPFGCTGATRSRIAVFSRGCVYLPLQTSRMKTRFLVNNDKCPVAASALRRHATCAQQFCCGGYGIAQTNMFL
jgi:hypothetical protein